MPAHSFCLFFFSFFQKILYPSEKTQLEIGRGIHTCPCEPKNDSKRTCFWSLVFASYDIREDELPDFIYTHHYIYFHDRSREDRLCPWENGLKTQKSWKKHNF